MKARNQGLATRCLEASVKAALAAMVCVPAARAADDAVLDLTLPKSVVEVGAGYVSDGSFKFGEYNGLQKKGAFAIGNIDVRGGAYGSDTDPTRWRITGTNLGPTTSIHFGRAAGARFKLPSPGVPPLGRPQPPVCRSVCG